MPAGRPFKRLAAETQRTRRHILENFAAVHGDKPLYRVDPRSGERIMLLKREHMQRFVNEKSATPFAQRNFLKTVRGCLEWAVGEGRIPENPALGVKRQTVKTTGSARFSCFGSATRISPSAPGYSPKLSPC